MDLEVEEVSELLNVSQTQLRRWISEGKIPVYNINQQYRFNRQEIEAWVMRQKLEKQSLTQEEKEEKSASKKVGFNRFGLFRALSKGDIYTDIEGDTKQQIIKETTKRIASKLNLDPEVLAELLMDREKLVPTAIGHSFAIPHARDFLLRSHNDIVTIVLLKKPIPWGALDGQPVHTVVFLLASDDKRHLGLIAKIACLASDQNVRKLLQSEHSKDVLIESVKEWETKLSPK
jgi:nitrogen PTS system EIIA component